MATNNRSLFFQSEFQAGDYLDTYYKNIDLDLIRKYIKTGSFPQQLVNIDQENSALILFYAKTVLPLIKTERRAGNTSLLEVGGGPTLCFLISSISVVDEIIFAEFLEANRKKIKNATQENCRYWRKFIKSALMLEQDTLYVKPQHIQERAALIAKRIKDIIFCDITKQNLGLLERLKDKKFDIVSTNFCPESITNSKKDWKNSLKNLLFHLKQGGRFIMTSLKGAHSYRVKNTEFPATPIYENDVEVIFRKLGLENAIIRDTENFEKKHGYKGIILATAIKR